MINFDFFENFTTVQYHYTWIFLSVYIKRLGGKKNYSSDLHTIFRYDLLSFKLLFSQEEKF